LSETQHRNAVVRDATDEANLISSIVV